jgi:hypothetical protein
MQTQEMIKKANDMLVWFEINKFQDELSYSRKVNLVLEFCDYLDNKQDWELADELETDDLDEVEQFRRFINQGADQWLDTVKTICLN